MKKLALILPLALVISFSFLPLAALAVGEACPSGNDGDCPGSEECDTSTLTCVAPDTGAGAGNVNTGGACTSDGQCSGNLACIHNICQIDPSLEDSGTAAAGGACGINDANGNPVQCPGGQSCVNNVCTGATGATNNPLGTSNTTGSSLGTSNTSGSSGGLQNPLGFSTIPQFLTAILGLMITVGGVVIVIMLVYVGFLFVTAQGAEEKIKEARHALLWTVIGALILLGAQAISTGIQATVSALGSGSTTTTTSSNPLGP